MFGSERPLEPSGSGGFSLSGPPRPLLRRRPASFPHEQHCPYACLCRAVPQATIARRPLQHRAPPPMKKRVMRAEEFEVLDAAGHVRLRIGLSNDDSPFFSMLDPGGQVRA